MDASIFSNPIFLTACKLLAVFLALRVFWPREDPERRMWARVLVLVVSVGALAGLSGYRPSADLSGLEDILAEATCAAGSGASCLPVSHVTRAADYEVDPLEAVGFTDCPDDCPQMRVLPARKAHAFAATIPGLAVGRSEVTLAQYWACMKDGACEAPVWMREDSDYNLETGPNRLYAEVGRPPANTMGVRPGKIVTTAQYLACAYENDCPPSTFVRGGGLLQVQVGLPSESILPEGGLTRAGHDLEGDMDPSGSGASAGAAVFDGLGVASERAPVVGVTWENAVQYTHWLSEKTGHPYRLMTSEEWEFAAIGGIATVGMFGEKDAKWCALDLDGSRPDAESLEVDRIQGPTRGPTRGPTGNACQAVPKALTPVESLTANSYGLFGLQSEVWEWVADCGRAQKGEASSQACSGHLVRGGDHGMQTYVDAQSAAEVSEGAHAPGIGFRVARPLATY